MKWFYTDGWALGDFASVVAVSDSAELTADQKRPFIAVSSSAASKTITLGLDVGDTAIVTNVGGVNAVTLKNVAGDSGTSLATGKTALVIASQTANASTILILN